LLSVRERVRVRAPRYSGAGRNPEFRSGGF
jgi:hypothetical protein